MSDPETVTGAPGVQSHVPGQDTNPESAAGVAPGAGDLDAAPDPNAPAMDALDNSGDSLGDDADLPEEGLPGDGDSIAGETTAATEGLPGGAAGDRT